MYRNNHSHVIYTCKQCNTRSTKAVIGLEGSFDNFTDFFLCWFHPFSRGIWCDTEIQEWLFHWHVTAIKQNWWLGKRIQRIMILKDINKKQQDYSRLNLSWDKYGWIQKIKIALDWTFANAFYFTENFLKINRKCSVSRKMRWPQSPWPNP